MSLWGLGEECWKTFPLSPAKWFPEEMRNGDGVGGKEWKNSSKEKKMTFFPLKQGVIDRSEIPGSMFIRNTKGSEFFFFFLILNMGYETLEQNTSRITFLNWRVWGILAQSDQDPGIMFLPHIAQQSRYFLICINIVYGCIAGSHVDWKGLFIFKQTDEEGGSPPPQLDLDWWGHTMGFSTPAINRSLFVVWKRKTEVQEKGGVIRR